MIGRPLPKEPEKAVGTPQRFSRTEKPFSPQERTVERRGAEFLQDSSANSQI